MNIKQHSKKKGGEGIIGFREGQGKEEPKRKHHGLVFMARDSVPRYGRKGRAGGGGRGRGRKKIA